MEAVRVQPSSMVMLCLRAKLRHPAWHVEACAAGRNRYVYWTQSSVALWCRQIGVSQVVPEFSYKILKCPYWQISVCLYFGSIFWKRSKYIVVSTVSQDSVHQNVSVYIWVQEWDMSLPMTNSINLSLNKIEIKRQKNNSMWNITLG